MTKTSTTKTGKRKPADEPISLTDAAIKKYVRLKRRRRIRDFGAKSLYLIIEPSGHKSFEMRFRRPDGRPAKIRLGEYDPSGREIEEDPVIGQPLTLAAAHALATKLHRERALGRDVIGDHKAAKHRRRAEAEERAATSFLACACEFFAEHRVKKWQTRPRRWRETARVLGLDYPPGSDPTDPTTEPQVIKGSIADTLGDRAVAEIDHHIIHEKVGEAGKRGIPGLKRRNRGFSDARQRALYSALSVLFGWLKKERKIVSNPCADVERPGPPPEGERVLTADEIRWFWEACDGVGEPFGSIFRLLLLLGQRLKEIAGMHRDEMSSDGAWNIPGTRTKNHRPHVVPLSTAAQALIPNREGLIFSTTGRTPPSGWSRAKRRLGDAMLALARNERGANAVIPRFKLHDARRTAITNMSELGIAPHVIELVVNHTSAHRSGVAGTYNKSELLPERKAALERWARFIALVTDRELFAAHQMFVASGDKAREAFNAAIAEGGERWSIYREMIMNGGGPANVVSLPRKRGR
jgi:integrase